MKTLALQTTRSAPRTQGFALIEALVAMGVVGVVIISLYAALTSGVNAVQVGREDMRATQILVKKVDQLRLFSWNQVTNNAAIPTSFLESFNPDNGTPTNVVSGNNNTNLMAGGNGNGNAYGLGQALPALVFSGTISISSFPDSNPAYNPDIRQATIQLNWTSQMGMPRSRTMTTFLARYGLQNYIYY